MRLLLGDMGNQPCFLHILEEPQYRRVRQHIPTRQAMEQLTHRERTMFPEEPEHFKLAVREGKGLASSHRYVPPHTTHLTYALLRRSRQLSSPLVEQRLI